MGAWRPIVLVGLNYANDTACAKYLVQALINLETPLRCFCDSANKNF